MGEVDGEKDTVGVLIQKFDLEDEPIIFTPGVSVQLIDTKNTDVIFDEIVSSESPQTSFPRSTNIDWNQILILSAKYENISNKQNCNYLFLFELFDYVQEPNSLFKPKSKALIKKRLAWAFLKPISSNGNFNLGKDLRLQLYKVGRNCSLPHYTCPIYHLYTQHKRRRYPGSLFVHVKAIDAPKPSSGPSQPMLSTSGDEVPSAGPTTEKNGNSGVELKVAEWSRLPGQSCKPPNLKHFEIVMGRRGASCIRFSHCGHFIACGSFSKVMVSNMSGTQLTTRLVGHSGLVYDLSWSPDDTFLISASADCSVIIWKTKPISKTPHFVLPHPSFVYCADWLTSNGCIVTGGRDGRIRCWSQSNLGCELLDEVAGHDGFISAMVANEVVVTGDSLGVVIVWLTKGEKLTLGTKLTLKYCGVIDAIHMHPARRRIIVSTRLQGSYMIDLATGVTLRNYPCGYLRSRSVTCISPCGTLLFYFDTGNMIKVIEFETGRHLATYSNIFPDLRGAQTEVSGCITYHPHEHMFAVAVLGCNFPVVILKFDYEKNDADILGLRHEEEKLVDYLSPELTDLTLGMSKENLITDNPPNYSIEDKLAAIVRNVDRILALRRDRPARVSPSSTLRKTTYKT